MQKGKVEIIVNDQGNRITPSYVAFTEEERLVGDSAKNQAAANPRNTVFDVKYVQSTAQRLHSFSNADPSSAGA